MDAYHVALFLHIVTMIIAAGATAVTNLAVGRRARARTVREALEWHDVLISTSKLFPISLGLFLATGVYMVSRGGLRAWSSGFVVAGLVSIALLLGSGIYLGVKAKALRAVLERAANGEPEAPAPTLVPPPLVAILPAINLGVVLGAVFDMVTKPVGVPVALGVVGLGIVLSAGAGWLRRPASAGARAGSAARVVPNDAGVSRS